MGLVKTSPLVSIIIPSHNYERFLSKAIESVLGQTYGNWELVIIDDASTDHTKELVETYRLKRFKVVRNIKNIGVDASFDVGFKIATGEYICPLCADDWLPSDNLKTRIEVMLQSDFEVIHAGLMRIGTNEKRYIKPLNLNNSSDLKRFLLRGKERDIGINSATFLWKKEVLTKVGLRSTLRSNYHHNDYEYSLRLATMCRTTFVDKNVYYYRIHSDSLSKNQNRDEKYFAELYALEDCYLKSYLNSSA